MVPPMPSSDRQEPKVIVTDLAAQRGGRLIFRGLSFTAEAGEAVMVAGPNGSGKSTLLRLLAGLAQPDAGSLTRLPSENDGLRFAGHRDGLKSGLTVEENLSFWSAIYNAPERSVTAAIDRFALSRVSDMPVDVLSAGWRRRAGLARLILGSAPLWILDEPYTALDKDNVSRIDGILSEHIANGGIVILATHQSPGFETSQTVDMATYEATYEALADEVPW